MEYVIREPKEEKLEKKVEVWLEKRADNGIVLNVGKWRIFELWPDGRGRLCGCLSRNNKEGLQIDKDGQIKLMD